MSDNIILISIPEQELRNLMRGVVKEELTAMQQSKKEEALLSSKELCKWLNISLSVLNTWKAQGKIPFKKLGKRIFYVKEDVIKAMQDSNYYKLKNLQ